MLMKLYEALKNWVILKMEMLISFPLVAPSQHTKQFEYLLS